MSRQELLVLFVLINLRLVFSVELSAHVVQTKNGPLQGFIQESRSEAKYITFTGIRFANPVIRFEAPEPLEEKWTTPKLAKTPGDMCPQMSMAQIPGEGENEDCLFLNVHVPQKVLESTDDKKIPVMFFVHGGGFISGDGHSIGAEYIMENEDAILVTTNYRMSVFGFLNTEDNVVSSNNGLRDLIMGLTWTKENIAGFNGDPSQVTVFGLSAGAVAVHYLLLSPLSQGLFQRAILQSGSHAFWSHDTYPKQSATLLAIHLGCQISNENSDTQSKEIRRCLESKSAAELIKAQSLFAPRWPDTNMISRFSPSSYESSEKQFFAGYPNSLGNRMTKYPNKMPVLTGVTCDEGFSAFAGPVLSNDEYIKDMNENWESVAPLAFFYDIYFSSKDFPVVSKKLRDFYFGKGLVSYETKQKLINIYSDTMFLLPAIFAAAEMAADGFPVYPYLFCYVGNYTVSRLMSKIEIPGVVTHGDDYQYLFTHPYLGPPFAQESEDEAFSKALVKYWVHFAKYGKPSMEWNQGSTVTFSPIKFSQDLFTNDNFNLLRFDRELKVVPLGHIKDRIQFWLQLLMDHPSQREAPKMNSTNTSEEILTRIEL